MHIFVNDQSIEVPQNFTIRNLIEHLKLNEGPVAVERNREVVVRALHGSTQLEEDDHIEIVHFVGGG